jgi:hypothetical protein
MELDQRVMFGSAINKETTRQEKCILTKKLKDLEQLPVGDVIEVHLLHALLELRLTQLSTTVVIDDFELALQCVETRAATRLEFRLDLANQEGYSRVHPRGHEIEVETEAKEISCASQKLLSVAELFCSD